MVSAQRQQLIIAAGLRCAQRLTASMVSARVAITSYTVALEVLNALRHQWFRHDRCQDRQQ